MTTLVYGSVSESAPHKDEAVDVPVYIPQHASWLDRVPKFINVRMPSWPSGRRRTKAGSQAASAGDVRQSSSQVRPAVHQVVFVPIVSHQVHR